LTVAVFSLTSIRSRLDSAGDQVFTVVQTRPTWFGRTIAGAVALAASVVVLTLVVVLVIPALLLALGVGLVAWAAYSVRRALRGARGPNGVLDERRNVRVVVRDDAGV
jgi:hypothetical protein